MAADDVTSDDPPEYPELPAYARALFFGVWREIARVYWNKHQRAMSPRGEDDPEIPGFTVRPFCWEGTEAEEALPNFVFGEAELRWHKYPGRSMTANVTWTPDQWVAWFNAATEAIAEFEDLCEVCGESSCRRSCLEPQAHDDTDNPF